jgi:hypothetical protein
LATLGARHAAPALLGEALDARDQGDPGLWGKGAVEAHHAHLVAPVPEAPGGPLAPVEGFGVASRNVALAHLVFQPRQVCMPCDGEQRCFLAGELGLGPRDHLGLGDRDLARQHCLLGRREPLEVCGGAKRLAGIRVRRATLACHPGDRVRKAPGPVRPALGATARREHPCSAAGFLCTGELVGDHGAVLGIDARRIKGAKRPSQLRDGSTKRLDSHRR